MDHAPGPLKIHGLKAGVYVLKLMGEGGEIMTRKIIVQ
jgi:hypothetical protein